MKQTVEEAAKECRRTTAQSMGVYAQYHSIDECPNHGITYDEIAEAAFIKGAEWQAKQSPWISVKERLPENNTVVLTRGAYGFLICQLSTLGEWETGANVNEERLGITHWMSIPSFDEILEANRDVLERIKD